jgi:2-polyprenyl-3-methyl-5-hydroxy-6-metoxy-1,4-benzoquinol methylase
VSSERATAFNDPSPGRAAASPDVDQHTSVTAEPLGSSGAVPRFRFGRNWRRYLRVVDEARIAEAERSLREMLGVADLRGRSFLDVGSGSGLFSLAAMRLGAARVHSFDYDPESVACTQWIKARHLGASAAWTVERGSALDPEYLARLGRWDVVYSWGVLHHTGRMWEALANVAPLVAPSGALFISIYNDQGRRSAAWSEVKRLYNRNPAGRALVLAAFVPYFTARTVLAAAARLRNPARRNAEYRQIRGMSLLYDWIDWLGGYPFEVARPEAIIRFYLARGFSLAELTTDGGGHGCNQFVFRAPAAG